MKSMAKMVNLLIIQSPTVIRSDRPTAAAVQTSKTARFPFRNMMAYKNKSEPCFSGTDLQTTNISIRLQEIMMSWASPSFLILSFPAILLNILSFIIVIKTESNSHSDRNIAIGEGPIHLMLLAISDVSKN